MDGMCHVRVLWLGCGTVRGHMEVAGDLEGERQVSCIWMAVRGAERKGRVICAWPGATESAGQWHRDPDLCQIKLLAQLWLRGAL